MEIQALPRKISAYLNLKSLCQLQTTSKSRCGDYLNGGNSVSHSNNVPGGILRCAIFLYLSKQGICH